MGIIDSIKEGIQGHFEKQRKRKEMMEQLNVQAEVEKQRIFQEQFKKDALEVAKAQAYREAAEKSGLQKLRATNRAKRLNENNVTPGTFFEKFSDYTKKNIAKREENLERTRLMRETADKMKQERDQKSVIERQQRTQNSPIGLRNSSWKP